MDCATIIFGPDRETIDWTKLARLVSTLPAEVPGILEIAYELNETTESVVSRATESFSKQARIDETLQESV